jgi:hypothetical protein
MKQFDVLIGEWVTVSTHPQLPTAIHGHVTFEWLKDGALLVWQDWVEGEDIPSAYSVIGHDDAAEACTMLYTDVRGVARVYQMSLEGGVWKMWRNSADFSQRMTATFSDNNNTINWRGEMSHDGSRWEEDLSMTFTRKG